MRKTRYFTHVQTSTQHAEKEGTNTHRNKEREIEQKNPTICLLILVSFANYLSTYDQSFFEIFIIRRKNTKYLSYYFRQRKKEKKNEHSKLRERKCLY